MPNGINALGNSNFPCQISCPSRASGRFAARLQRALDGKEIWRHALIE